MSPVASSAYVGMDRRRGLVPVERVTARHVVVPAAVLVALSLAALSFRAAGAALPEDLDAQGLTRLAETASAVVGTVVVMLAFVRWRLTGEATPLWIGAAVAVLSVFVDGLAGMAPVVFPGAVDAPVLLLLQPTGAVVAVALLAMASVGPEVDTRLRPAVVVTAVMAAATASSAVLVLFQGAADALRSPSGSVVLTAGWFAVAALMVRATLRRQRPELAPVAAMAVGFGLAQLLVAVTADAGDLALSLPGPALLRFLALAALLVGSRRSLEEAFLRQRAQLFHSTVEVETLHARRRAEHHADEERLHDAKNALLAIDGATQTLERFRDRLSPEDRATLAEGLAEEIKRLQRLIAADRGRNGDPVPADIHEVLQPVVTTERVRGLRVEYDEPVGLAASCSPSDLAEVVRGLLDNARRHAPGLPVTVRAVPDGDWVVVYVEDRGPGVARAERDSVFERRERRPDAEPADAIGLFVARRLAQDQGGDIWVEARPGGGARFGVCVPRVDGPAPEPQQESHASTGGST